MKSFELLKNHLRPLGIMQFGSNPIGPFAKILIHVGVFGVFSFCIPSMFRFFLFAARSFSEYVESFYYVLVNLFIVVLYAIYLRQGAEYNRFLIEIDAIIEQSRCIIDMSLCQFGLIQRKKFSKTSDCPKSFSLYSNIFIVFIQITT